MKPLPDERPSLGDGPEHEAAPDADREPIRRSVLAALVIVVLLVSVPVVAIAEGESLVSFILAMLGVGCYSVFVWQNRRAKVWPIFWRDEDGTPRVMEQSHSWLAAAGLAFMLLAAWVS